MSYKRSGLSQKSFIMSFDLSAAAGEDEVKKSEEGKEVQGIFGFKKKE